MKILSYSQNNSNYSQRQKFFFGAGLTANFSEEIRNTNVSEISNKLSKKGIPNDFKGNKIVAWGCDKTVEIIETLNRKYHLRLTQPKGIYVEDFKNLKIDNTSPDVFGTCNLTPSQLMKGSDKRIQPQIIFFNTLHNWNSIDSISDVNYKAKKFSTDFFLYEFWHDFAHAIHLGKLRENFNGKDLVQKLELVKDKNKILEYQKKYGQKTSLICDYAYVDPMEAVACDIARVIVESLDKTTLQPTRNPFIGTSYEKLSLWQKADIPNYSDEERPLKEILRNFWNGKFE